MSVPGMLIDVQDDELDALLASETRPILIYFWATWCGPCKLMVPVFRAVLPEWEYKIAVVRIEVDKCPGLIQRFEVVQVPTLLFFEEGRIVDRVIGAQSPRQMHALIASHLPSVSSVHS